MTYKELKDNFFEEVGKIDVGKLSLGFNGLRDYAELLKIMADIPETTSDEKMEKLHMDCCCGSGFEPLKIPKK